MRKPFEITVVSGKGGTGKTTVTAALAACLPNKVLVDCDVEAANLSLWLSPKEVSDECFVGGMIAVVDETKCTNCGLCATKCHFKAITGSDSYHLNKIKCEGCGVCAYVCPAKAITLKERESGRVLHSETTKGPLVHAHLHPGEGNSGKLVHRVRELAREKARSINADIILADGPPGIACPAIAALSGTGLALVVTEPGLSALHDLERLARLLAHFHLPMYVIINRCDLSPAVLEQVRTYCAQQNIEVLAELPYDSDMIAAHRAGVPVVEFSDGPAANALKKVADRLPNLITEV